MGAGFQKEQEWKEEYTGWKRLKRNWGANNPAIYNLLLSYCILAMKNKLEGMDGNDKIRDEQDRIRLRLELQKIMQQQGGTKNKMVSVVALDKKLYCLWQSEDQSLESYLLAHVGLVDGIKATDGHPGYSHAGARVVAKEQGLDYKVIKTSLTPPSRPPQLPRQALTPRRTPVFICCFLQGWPVRSHDSNFLPIRPSLRDYSVS